MQMDDVISGDFGRHVMDGWMACKDIGRMGRLQHGRSIRDATLYLQTACRKGVAGAYIKSREVELVFILEFAVLLC